MTQNKDYKQVIIARKDLNMSPGKLAAQVSHASMAFLTNQIKLNAYKKMFGEYYRLECAKWEYGKRVPMFYRHPDLYKLAKQGFEEGKDYIFIKHCFEEKPRSMFSNWKECSEEEVDYRYKTELSFEKDLYENWIEGSFTKVVCGARNLHQLMRVTDIAIDMGLINGIDYFIIKDNCLTELEPEEIDEHGVGRTITCIGFIPLSADIAAQLSKKYQLY